MSYQYYILENNHPRIRILRYIIRNTPGSIGYDYMHPTTHRWVVDTNMTVNHMVESSHWETTPITKEEAFLELL